MLKRIIWFLSLRSWLRRRGFKPSICEKYQLGFVPHGDYALRIIVPIFVENEKGIVKATWLAGVVELALTNRDSEWTRADFARLKSN